MFWRRQRTEEDFAEEIRAHLEHEVERLVDAGMTRDDARTAAHRRFGSLTRTREQFHDARRTVWLEQFAQDLRYARRGLWHSRTFVATTVLTLAVGMSLVTVVFAIFNAYVLRPFAVRDPYNLYAIGWRSQEAGGSTFRWRDYEEIRTRDELFDGIIGEAMARRISADGQQLLVGFVTGDYFETLGPRVLLGRALTADDARTPGGQPVALLTDQAWARLFDRDPSVLGRELEVSGRKLVVVGVMAGFGGLDDLPRDVWVPITMFDALAGGDLFGTNQPRQMRLTARLRHGVTPQQVQGSLTLSPFETRVAGRIDPVRAHLELQATPNQLTFQGLALLSPVFAAFGLVLVAACANASNVMLARANARHREIGVRLSIGASRGRIVRQLMTEGLLLALLAGVTGLALAGALLRIGMVLFVAMLPPALALRVRFVPVDFDHRVFLFAVLIAGATTTVFALLPALQATRLRLTEALRGQASATIRSSSLRNLLVTSQVAVSLLLLVVSVTLVRNGVAIRATDLGMRTAGVISVRPGGNDARALLARTHTALTLDPIVEQVVVTSRNPLFGESPRTQVLQASGMVPASYRFVSPEYFAMLGMPIVRGRGFAPEEAGQEAPVAIVSAAAARRLWPDDDPIGKTMRIPIPPAGQRRVADTVHELRKAGDAWAGSLVVTVIGVTTDVVSGFVYEGFDAAHLYLPTSPTGSRAGDLMVRLRPDTRGPARAQLEGTQPGVRLDELKTILTRAHPDPLAFDILSLDEMVALQMFPLRAASWLGSLLSAVAVALSVSGLYGVLTYVFGQRRQEIGIRMALGASASAVIGLVVRQSARLAGLGAAVGVVLAFTVMKILSTRVRLDNVSVIDPGAFAVSIVLIAAAVAVASYAPARRAARVDPLSMLRTDA
jgi:predicted permease